MAKVAVPPSKPPVDKGQHFLLSFPLVNIKEPVKVDLQEEDDVGSSCTVRVSFETFSPHKKYEKVLSLPEPVCLRQLSKNVNQKSLSIILLKAACAPPPSPKSSPSQAPAPLIPAVEASNDVAPIVEEVGASQHPIGHSEMIPEDLDAEARDICETDEGLEKRKKKKPKKKGRGSNAKSNEEETEEVEDKEVNAAREEIERLQSELQSARSNIQTHIKKELELAEAREGQASKKIAQFENELRRWQAEREVALAQCEECRARLTESHQAVRSLEVQIEKQRTVAKECEARVIEKQRQAAERERERLEREELLAQEEKRKEQEERRKRLEEERLRVAEEKKKKEVERKENARKREEERKMKEAEEERLKVERKRKIAAPTRKAKSAPDDGFNVLVSDSQKEIINKLSTMFPKDPTTASKMLEEAGKADGGVAFYICLQQLHEDHGNDAECGAAVLKMLAHPSAKVAISEEERGNFARKAMAKLKDHPAKLRECKSLIDKLTPEYGILAMSQFLSDCHSPGHARSKAPEQTGRADVSPWTGPLIEELPMEPVEPVTATPSKRLSRSSHREEYTEPGSPTALAEGLDEGWVLDCGTDSSGPCWTLDLPVPSIESLAEVSLDINQEAVRLTPMQGGPPVAQSRVPGDADAEGATAKWSKKKRILTIRMPQQAS